MDLDAYPTLKKRFAQLPISYVEVADFALADSTDLDKVYAAMRDFDPTGGTATGTAGAATGTAGAAVSNSANESGSGGTGGTSVGQTGVGGTGSDAVVSAAASGIGAGIPGTTSVIDANGNTLDVTRDVNDNITSVVTSDPSGNAISSTEVTTDIDGNVKSVTKDSEGNTTSTSTRDTASDGTVSTKTTSSTGTTSTSKTDATGTKTTVTDSSGTTTTTNTDTAGNTTTTTTDALGGTTTTTQQTGTTGSATRENDVLDVLAALAVPVAIIAFLSNFDFHLDNNIGGSIAGGLCGQFGNIFDKLFGLFDLIKSGKDKISDIGNDNEKDPVKKLKSIGFSLIIKEMYANIVKIIKKLVKEIKKRVKAMVDFSVSIASNIYNKIKKMAESILNFFSDINIGKFFLRIESFVASTASQFERITAEVLGLLMFRFCQFSDTLQTVLMGPATALTTLATAVATETSIAQNTSLRQTREAVSAGGIRITAVDREKAKAEAIATNNAPRAGRVTTKTDAVFDPQVDWQTPRGATLAENAAISTLTEDGITNKFSFSASLKSDVGNWQKVQSDVWVRLLRISEQTGKQYVVNSGFRDKAHNIAVGGSSDSIHMSGYAIDVIVSSADREDFFLAAERAGFTGIGIYNTFIHLDCGARRMWVAGHGSESGSSYALTGSTKNKWVNAIPKHNRDEYRKNSGIPVEQLARQNSLETKRAIAAEAATQHTKRRG